MSKPSVYAASDERKRIGRRTWRYALGLWLKRKPGPVKALQFAIDCAYSAGYSDGHEDQMKCRIRDAQECREKNGRHL